MFLSSGPPGSALGGSSHTTQEVLDLDISQKSAEHYAVIDEVYLIVLLTVFLRHFSVYFFNGRIMVLYLITGQRLMTSQQVSLRFARMAVNWLLILPLWNQWHSTEAPCISS